MMTLLASLRMVQTYERRHHIKFDWVVRSRPDLLIFAPIQPHCFYVDERTVYVDHLTTDMLLIMRRKLATPLLSVIDHYRNCSGVSWWQARMEALLKGAAAGAGAQHNTVAGTPIGVARGYPCNEECDTQHALWAAARFGATPGTQMPPEVQRPARLAVPALRLNATEPDLSAAHTTCHRLMRESHLQQAITTPSKPPRCVRRLSADPGETCLFGSVASCVMRVAKLCKALLTSERLMLAASGAMHVPDSLQMAESEASRGGSEAVRRGLGPIENMTTELLPLGKKGNGGPAPHDNVLLTVLRGELFREGGTHSHSQLSRNSTPSPSEMAAQRDAFRRIVDFVRMPAERVGWRWTLVVDVVASKVRVHQ